MAVDEIVTLISDQSNPKTKILNSSTDYVNLVNDVQILYFPLCTTPFNKTDTIKM